MEKIGLSISNKLNNGFQQEKVNQGFKEIKKSEFRVYSNQLKWVLLIGGSLFFFIRAIYMASTGGDCFGTINPPCSWFLLSSEIFLSGLTWMTGLSGVILLLKIKNKRSKFERLYISKIVLFTGISAYIVHFIRVIIWICLCVV